MHMFFKICDLKHFGIFAGKRVLESLFHKVAGLAALQSATLFKRDFNTGVFLGVLQNF